jgi:hypothetical protein
MTFDQTTDLVSKGQFLSIESLVAGAPAKIIFKAFITSFSENYASSWQTQQVYGRVDPIQTYQSTTRTINLGWKLVANDLSEAEDNFANAKALSGMLYPGYESRAGGANTISTGPLLRIKFMNLINGSKGGGGFFGRGGKGLLGTTSGFNIDPDFNEGFFDPGIEIFPKVINISTTFTVLHEENRGHGFARIGDFRTWDIGGAIDESDPSDKDKAAGQEAMTDPVENRFQRQMKSKKEYHTSNFTKPASESESASPISNTTDPKPICGVSDHRRTSKAEKIKSRT